MSVVFPPPFGPINPRIFPRSIARSIVLEHQALAEGEVEVRDFNQRIVHATQLQL